MVRDKHRDIIITKAAYIALTSLSPVDQKKVEKLLSQAETNFNSPEFKRNVQKLKLINRENIYALKSHKLRIIIKIEEDKINVLDIINRDVYSKFFKKNN